MKSTQNFTILPPDASRSRKTDKHGRKFAIDANDDTFEIILRGQEVPVPPNAETIDYISITLNEPEAQELLQLLLEWCQWKYRKGIKNRATQLLQQFRSK